MIQPRRGFLADLAEARAEAGDVSGALRTVGEIAVADTEAYARNLVAGALARAGQVAAAIDTAHSINVAAPTWKATALGEIATTQAGAGDFEGAIQTAESIATIACNDERDRTLVLADRDIAFFEIAVAQAKAGKTSESDSTVEMVSKSAARILTLREIAKIQAARQEFDAARLRLEYALRIAKDDKSDDQMWVIAQDQAAIGDIGGALQTASAIADGPEKAFALLAIAAAQTKAGEWEAAKANLDDGLRIVGSSNVDSSVDSMAAKTTFREALQVAGTIEIGGGTDVIALCEIGRAQAKAGSVAEAASTFQHARQAAMRYPEESYVAQLLQDIAVAQAEGGDVDGAVIWARPLASPIQRANALVGAAMEILRRVDETAGRSKRTSTEVSPTEPKVSSRHDP